MPNSRDQSASLSVALAELDLQVFHDGLSHRQPNLSVARAFDIRVLLKLPLNKGGKEGGTTAAVNTTAVVKPSVS